MKAVEYGKHTNASSAFVSTNSICQGQQVPILWPLIFKKDHEIVFANTSFKWSNLASYNAGVTVIIVGISNRNSSTKRLFSEVEGGETIEQRTENINAYLIGGKNIIISKSSKPISNIAEMTFGSKPVDGGNLLLSKDDLNHLNLTKSDNRKFIRQIFGSEEFISGKMRYCIWVEDVFAKEALNHHMIGSRINGVRQMRLKSTKASTRKGAEWPHRFDEKRQDGNEKIIVVPAVSSENREYLPCGYLPKGCIITNLNFGIFDAPLWNLSIIASRIHLVWIAAACGKLETRLRYSNTMGWNTFPVPTLTVKNKEDLTACAEEILIARERHFPLTIADLYNPEKMPEDLRRAHERNDEVLERIYIGRRFKNDTERLEKLFELYIKMTSKEKVG